MDVTGARGGVRSILFVGALLLWRADAPRCDFPATEITLRAIGQRLGRSCSDRQLNAIATRGTAILEHLLPRERTALSRAYLRFNVDQPVVVELAVPRASVPFWVADQGFRRTDVVLRNSDTDWLLYRKSFPPGPVGLGVNGLDRSPLAHYAVFIKSQRTRASNVEPPHVTLERRSRASWNVAIAAPGISAARDYYKPFQALPPELAGSILLQPSHADRHRAALASGRVWKTRVVATDKSSQIAIAFGADPERELVWTWTTAPDVTSTRLRICRERTDQPSDRLVEQGQVVRERERVIGGESMAVVVPNLLNDPVIRRHRVEVKGLEPDTVYRYSLEEGAKLTWSPWRTVKTAPERAKAMTFLYLGDAQTGLEDWGRLLGVAHRRHPSIDFMMLAGDLVDRGNERSNWDHFFLRAAGVFDRLPLLPCVGNHEYLDVGPRLYRAFFELPRNGPSGIAPDLVYHFEAGDACFAVLDSTLAAYDALAAEKQTEWLDRVLAETKARWKFVMLHHPLYPSHPWRDIPCLRERLVPIIDKHHVDFVLQGHDHAYQRTYPMRGHQRARAPSDGTIYLVAVSGDKFVDQTRRDYVEVGKSNISTYQTFEIDPLSRRLTYRAWTEAGTVVDELSIVKAAGRCVR